MIGIKTKEFWLYLFVAVAGGLASIFGNNEWTTLAGVAAQTFAALGYGRIRTQVKVSGLEEMTEPFPRLGLNTTEFWLSLIVAACNVITATYNHTEGAQLAGLLSAALVSMGYGHGVTKISRV